MNELKQAKIKLYTLLLKKPVDDLTEQEINIVYELAFDKDIKNHLNKFIQEKQHNINQYFINKEINYGTNR